MSVAGDSWACPACGVVERHAGQPATLARWLELVQYGHRERHAAEQANAQPIAAALVEAIEALAAFRVRLVVAPGDVERVREGVKRRSVPIDVYADDRVRPGRGYVMTPRRGVRELRPSTPGDNPGDER